MPDTTVTTSHRRISAYLARPAGDGPWPGVVVIPAAAAATAAPPRHRRAITSCVSGNPAPLAAWMAIPRNRHLAISRGRVLVGHPLLALPGVRVLLAARILAETGDVRRFRSADAFAMFSGTAPIPASSGQTERMRLNRGGDRQLNRALHAMALIQGRYHDRAKAYLARKRAEGKTQREAIRCLARKLARVVFEVLRRSTLATADAFAA